MLLNINMNKTWIRFICSKDTGTDLSSVCSVCERQVKMKKELVIFLIEILIIAVIIFIILPGLNDKEVMMIGEPVQVNIKTGFNNEINHDGKNKTIKMEKLAEYKISAVVKSKRYYFFDSASEVSPIDLLLVWGELDTKEMDDSINYSQSGRCIFTGMAAKVVLTVITYLSIQPMYI